MTKKNRRPGREPTPDDLEAEEMARLAREGVIYLPKIRKKMDTEFRRAVRLCARYAGIEEKAKPHVDAIALLAASAVADVLFVYLEELTDSAGAPRAQVLTPPAVRAAARQLAPICNLVAYHFDRAPAESIKRISTLAEADAVRRGSIPAWQLVLEKIFEFHPLLKTFPADPAKAGLYVLDRLLATAPNVPKPFWTPDQAALDGATAVISELQAVQLGRNCGSLAGTSAENGYVPVAPMSRRGPLQ